MWFFLTLNNGVIQCPYLWPTFRSSPGWWRILHPELIIYWAEEYFMSINLFHVADKTIRHILKAGTLLLIFAEGFVTFHPCANEYTNSYAISVRLNQNEIYAWYGALEAMSPRERFNSMQWKSTCTLGYLIIFGALLSPWYDILFYFVLCRVMFYQCTA